MKNKFIFIKNIILKNILLASLLLTQSCSSLTKSKIINTKQNEAISVLELKIIIDDKEEKDNSGIFGECHLVFGEDNGDVKFNNSKNYSFYIFKTNTGIIKIKGLKCSNWGYYFKNRYLSLGDLEFIVKPNRINYLGNLVINYESRGFGFLDIFGLGAIVNDSKGSFDIKIYDNVQKSIGFLKEFYPELKNKKVSKSLVHQSKNYKAKINELNDFEKEKNNQTNNNEFVIENNDKKDELNKKPSYENRDNLDKNNEVLNQPNYNQNKENIKTIPSDPQSQDFNQNNPAKNNDLNQLNNKNNSITKIQQNSTQNQNINPSGNSFDNQSQLNQNYNQKISNSSMQNPNQINQPRTTKSYENSSNINQDIQAEQINPSVTPTNQNSRIGKLIKKNNSSNTTSQNPNLEINQINKELPVEPSPSPTRYRPAEIQ